jgi:hypothetical protein
MPTLIRLVVFLIVLAGLAGAAILALAFLVEPTQREIIIDIPRERLRL